MKIRRGDLVQVTNGDDARPTPRKVLQLVDGGRKVVVEGVNRVYKHVRRGHPKSPQGGRLSLEMPIDISNVQLYCDACGRGVRVGVSVREDGTKFRVCKRCGKEHGQIGAAKANKG